MTGHDLPNPDRRWALLVDRALAGLSESERLELDAMPKDTITDEGAELETLVATLDLALGAGATDSLPAQVRNALEERIDYQLSGEGLSVDESAVPGTLPMRRIWMPWVSVAALIAFALMGWWPRLFPAPGLPLEQERAVTLDTSGSQIMPWDENTVGVRGNVVWNPGKQKGYLHFHDLRELDESTGERYHLWIFEAGEDGTVGPPLDGGRFEVHLIGRRDIVRIYPERRLERPVGYAVTLEPGVAGVLAGGQDGFDPGRVVLTTGAVGER